MNRKKKIDPKSKTFLSMLIQVTNKRSFRMFGLLHPLNFQWFTNATDPNGNISSVYHHFLVGDFLRVPNIQSSGQLIALGKQFCKATKVEIKSNLHLLCCNVLLHKLLQLSDSTFPSFLKEFFVH